MIYLSLLSDLQTQQEVKINIFNVGRMFFRYHFKQTIRHLSLAQESPLEDLLSILFQWQLKILDFPSLYDLNC